MLNEGKRFRHLELGIFLTPDPLEYVDGFNPYIYCSQNPWGRWDSEGLFWDTFWDVGNIIYDVGAAIYNHVHRRSQCSKQPLDRCWIRYGCGNCSVCSRRCYQSKKREKRFE
ncbi:MAG: hypothetical protein IKS15_05380 [Opitutales bacterium]|nr:hypothetical protein [Opitutales bacterium]